MKKEIAYKGFTITELAMAAGGRLLGGDHRRCPTAVCTDSREVSGESAVMFAAIRGERVDGNDYVLRAMEAGACCALCERVPEGEIKGSLILVEDTVAALGRLGRTMIERTAPLTVAITGSVGKTTTKQFTASVVSQKYETLATEGNFNSEIGLPMTLLGLTPCCEAAVLELGMSGAGEISRMSKICSPDIAVITCIGSSHIEMLGSREGIRDAKMEIIDGMKKGGRLVLNGDEPLLAGVEGALYVSACGKGDYNITNVRTGAMSTRFDLAGEVILRDLEIPAIGDHMLLDAAYAAVVGILLGLTEEQIRAGLAAYETTGLRQRITHHGDLTLIEDCYNANPESMRAALSVLKTTKGQRKLAVLGDMRELGEGSPAYHQSVGEAAARVCDLLFTFGELASDIARGAADAGMNSACIYSFGEEQAAELIAVLTEQAGTDDAILFKASRAMELERIIDGLKNNRQI